MYMKILFQRVVGTFCLTIGLRMVCRGKTQCSLSEQEKLTLEVREKTRISV